MAARNDEQPQEIAQPTPATQSGSVASNSSVRQPETPQQKRPTTEVPVEPHNPYQPFIREAETPIGNPKAQLALRMEGQLGVFYDRENTTRTPTLVEINMANLHGAVSRVLTIVVRQELLAAQNLDANTIALIQNDMAATLADGVVVATYLKLRNTNYADDRVAARFRRLPKVPAPFQVPQPYAYAISQLGQIKISGMTQELYYSPTCPDGADTNFCLPVGRHWSPLAYAQMVELAIKIGLRFTIVDLTVKMGSSWWLYRATMVGDVLQLQCPFPEENFTENTAIVATLMCNGALNTIHNPIVAENAFGNTNFGSMARIDIPDIAVNTYYAIIDSSSVDYKVTN